MALRLYIQFGGFIGNLVRWDQPMAIFSVSGLALKVRSPVRPRQSLVDRIGLRASPVRRSPGRPDPLVWFRAGLQQLERLLELLAHRKVQTLAARKPRHEPLLIEWDEVAVDDQLLKGARHRIAQLRLVAAKHDAVRLIRQQLASDLEFLARIMLGDQSIEQHLVARIGVDTSVLQGR